MTVEAYTDILSTEIEHAGLPAHARAFIFGSAVRSDSFHDIDVGIIGAGDAPQSLATLRESLYDAPIPYKVDVVDFDHSDDSFKSYVFEKEPLLWIR